jgi:hypothetical protein
MAGLAIRVLVRQIIPLRNTGTAYVDVHSVARELDTHTSIRSLEHLVEPLDSQAEYRVMIRGASG